MSIRVERPAAANAASPDFWLRAALAALLRVHGTEAVLRALLECACAMVDGRADDAFATAARRAAVDLSRAARSSAALESFPGATPYAELLDPAAGRAAPRAS